MGKTEHPLKIAFYSPYLNMMGGGERYILSIAGALSTKHEVYFYADSTVRDKIRKNFNININRVRFIPNDLFRTNNLFIKLKKLSSYDILFYMTDGSLFFSSARKNFLIVQSPVHLPGTNILSSLKGFNWKILCYSSFMQGIIKERLGKDATILSPCIEIDAFKSDFGEKENTIISVGRYFKRPHDKKLEVLIEIFKDNFNKCFSGWKLVIAGGLTEESGQGVLANIRKIADGFPIEIVVNPDFLYLFDLYKKAKLYWHAAGFGEDLLQFPERAEHFGITTLESMASGTVPVVFGAGGQLDIISEGTNGYLWKSENELVEKSVNLIENSELLRKISNKAVEYAQQYSCNKFNEKLEKIIYGQ